VPPPTLPAGIGVSWLRDVGGTNDTNGDYHPSSDRYVTTSGGTTGPSPAGTVLPALEYGLFGSQLVGVSEFPDGTAKYPWNGFAGEGVTTSVVSGQYVVSFPGGSCGVGDWASEDSPASVMPSPDGTKAAVFTPDISFYIGKTTVRIVSLSSGTTCPTISSTSYGGIVGEPGPNDPWEQAIGHFVWSPDSTAVVYPVIHHVDDNQMNQRAMDRLDATAGATPQRIVQPDGIQWLVPTGWSVADRLLVSEFTSNGTTLTSKLVSMSTAGNGLRTIDTASSNFFTLNEGWNYGYYVPGTSSIVYAATFATVTNTDGYPFPRFRLQIIADAANASAAPLATSPALVWHQIHTGGDPDNPTFTQAPNQDALEGFTH
jgi:hypothetical protein